jgi:AraC-like DNA-binding protein
MPLPPVRHDFLEILVGLDGEGRLAVGERLVEFAAGDVLAVDANQTHRVIAFWGWRRRLLHVRFLPDLVYNLGSPMCDYVFLAPFYFQSPAVNPVLPGRHPRSAAVHAALRRLVLCVAAGATDSRAKAGSKAFLLEVIYLLAEHLHSGSAADTALARQSQRASRLSRLIDYINASFSERITVNDAAALVGMSRTPFMKLFRRATGSTFVSYLNQARLKEGRRLLSETDLSIAQVAASVGFSDQSYFDRRFRLRFGEAPRDYRRRVGADPGASDGAERISVSSGDPATVAGSGRRGRQGRR